MAHLHLFGEDATPGGTDGTEILITDTTVFDKLFNKSMGSGFQIKRFALRTDMGIYVPNLTITSNNPKILIHSLAFTSQESEDGFEWQTNGNFGRSGVSTGYGQTVSLFDSTAWGTAVIRNKNTCFYIRAATDYPESGLYTGATLNLSFTEEVG